MSVRPSTRPLSLSGRLVVASHNAGKVREIGDLLAPLGIEAVSAAALDLPEPEETETTFEGNALLKARAAAQAAGLPALADDSGLEVAALDGAPGVYSARWGGPTRNFMIAMTRVTTLLAEKPDRSARFVCALALAAPDGAELVVEGEVRGRIADAPRGNRGFGYDPIFIAEGHDITFGEMEPARKHAISHRAQAFAKLLDALR
ncbi:MAG: RdgB/HAM1 family non-canonical purine NTP pyrophosphatase [Alphaproteobacteria bacterium]|nr:RdgB/HAM1 family non-canonical purine NTP pyrophosphatase [Alphaproteobacteria bacterium]